LLSVVIGLFLGVPVGLIAPTARCADELLMRRQRFDFLPFPRCCCDL